MKLNAILVVPALLGALLLTACGEKAEETTEAAPATTEAAPAPAAAEAAPAPAASTAGGYEPTAEERIPGITVDPAAAPAAAEAPAEAAPAEAAPAAAQ